MPNHPEPARDRISHAFFPPAEAPSFCSRATPLVPARDDLRTFELERALAEASGTLRISAPGASPSSRPTYVPDEVLDPAAESDPLVTVSTPPALEVPGPLERPSAPATIPAPPRVSARAAEPTASEPPRRQGRALFARALFVLLFGGVATLLGLAYKAKLVDADGAGVVVPRGAR
jgi:hypothetical protein